MAKRILITEDDPSFIRAISYILDKEGYEVLTAGNGLEGLMMAQKEKPDLMILDVMLPGLDGFEVCNRLRNEPETAKLPIMMLSAKGQDVDRATGLRMGADEYLGKPIDRDLLISTVQSLIAKNNS